MSKSNSRTRPGQSLEERRAKRMETLAAQREASEAQREADRRERHEWYESRCCYCRVEVGAHNSTRVGYIEKACLDCVKRLGQEKIDSDRFDRHLIRRNRTLKNCPSCNERQEKSNFSSFWTGRDYADVCKACIEICGETELRDILLQHRGTAPIMSGGLPTLGKDR